MAHHHDGCLKLTATKHIAYELSMLGAMAGARTNEPPPFGVAGTAFLEATLVHVRCLSEFLQDTSRGRWEHRVLALDFFPKGTTWRPRDVLSKDEGKAIARRVVHVYCDRDEWEPTWDRVGLAQRVLDRFGEFVRDLDVEAPTRAEGFRPGLEAARVNLQLSIAGDWTYYR